LRGAIEGRLSHFLAQDGLAECDFPEPAFALALLSSKSAPVLKRQMIKKVSTFVIQQLGCEL